MTGAPLGNKNRSALTTPELRQMAFQQYLKHLSAGQPKRTWTFDHPEVSIAYRSLEKYIREYPLELPSSQVEVAMAKGEKTWIDLGIKMMLGQVEGKVCPAIFQIMMRNIYKWDREDIEPKTVKTEAESLLRAWKGEIDELLDL